MHRNQTACGFQGLQLRLLVNFSLKYLSNLISITPWNLKIVSHPLAVWHDFLSCSYFSFYYQ